MNVAGNFLNVNIMQGELGAKRHCVEGGEHQGHQWFWPPHLKAELII